MIKSLSLSNELWSVFTWCFSQWVFLLWITTLGCSLDGRAAGKTDSPPIYLDPLAPLDARLGDLMGRMTLEEKIAQVRSTSLRASAATEEGIAEAEKSVRDQIKNGIGQIENTFDPRPPRKSVEDVNALQRILVENTRLKIPALVGSECLHGHSGYNSTVFPTPLAMASSWNPELVHQAFDIVGLEARARGAHEAHTPVLDLGRDARWGRIEETYGEDTYLTFVMALAIVSGLQGGMDGNPGTTHIVSAPKHFAGYGQVSGGRNFAATPVDDKTLFDEVLPPFEAAVIGAQAQGMMASHCDVGGVPAHGNRWLLTDLLRGRWGFKGMVVSDYNDIPRLDEYHHVVSSVEEAARMAIMAGLDLDLPAGAGYASLGAAIRKDPKLEAYLDLSVRRILRLKFLLGLFENPYADVNAVEEIVGSEAHEKVAEDLACESITLLKNAGNLLPLKPEGLKTIAVIGPKAASNDMGTYSMKNDHLITILDGIRRKVGPGVRVIHEEGCRIGKFEITKAGSSMEEFPLASEAASIQKAVDAAESADVAIVCVGGDLNTSMEAFYQSGVKGDRSTLDLLGNQQELVMRVIGTGKPVIVVLMGGKPYSIPDVYSRADVVINTFYLGQCNGIAVAKVLFGEVNPSGKLPITIPRSVGQLPAYYSQKAQSFYKEYLDEKAGPLFSFGFGLSYTTFGFSALDLGKGSYRLDEPVTLNFKVKNTGDVAGAEVAQVYFRDKVASVIRPARLLVRFEKVFLKPGEEREISFQLDPQKDLSFTGIDMKRVVEPGTFEVMVGDSSSHIVLRSSFDLQ